MRICAAQTRPIKGDIQSNVDNHKKLIDLAVSNGADTILFPELSITGYEPELSEQLATNEDDSRLDEFQEIADTKQVTIGVGVPTRDKKGICISMIVFRPLKSRQTYSKKYLHPDEEEFFVSGPSSTNLIDNTHTALAICHELSVPEHSENSFRNGAEIYIASVAKTVNGVTTAVKTLSDLAKRYSMTVLMSNCLGVCGGLECAGKSSIWNRQGLLVGQLDDANEGIIIIDTSSQEIIEEII